MIDRFWSKLSVNALSIAIPATLTFPGFGILVRIADAATVGTIMWTWFLIGTAAALNAGLNPSLTNDFGKTSNSDPKFRFLTAHYLQASNVVYSVICAIVLFWSYFESSDVLPWSVLLLQLGLIWMTGIIALLITTLNFFGFAVLTAKSKLWVNSAVIVLPIAVLAMTGSTVLAIFGLFVVKFGQFWILLQQAKRLGGQSFEPLARRPFDVLRLKRLLGQQWRMVLIALSQMAFAFIDRWSVVAVFGISAYQSYSGIQDVLSKTWMLSSIFIILLHPVFSAAGTRTVVKERLALKYTVWLFAFGGTALLLCYLSLDLFLYYLFDLEPTLELRIICRNLIIGLAVSLSYMLYNTLLIATGRQPFVLTVSLVSLLAYCIALFPVIHTWGVLGLSYLFVAKFTGEALCFHGYSTVKYYKERGYGKG